ncbi:uncharacterized protein LACBIDRAFT_329319 [Laccaria bicolor S238N-H82]|uniref:Predicted protein n=1 Tax=Laccaria bicolor (strain S238N-H82 / ATCC MYA-4686) TaxID=486041 RepID=B0DHN6_LACBS|nr:uncharacterized protein LACBIDRAFT_329319 [Laccaria bicolor S238N-H82]EDR05865.1 predicted protein [Laccaria bicolor S238N-H82]|eukprot:XP_001883541.1 predicted protein [Laccaria bicolor S238N-H82]
MSSVTPLSAPNGFLIKNDNDFLIEVTHPDGSTPTEIPPGETHEFSKQGKYVIQHSGTPPTVDDNLNSESGHILCISAKTNLARDWLECGCDLPRVSDTMLINLAMYAWYSILLDTAILESVSAHSEIWYDPVSATVVGTHGPRQAKEPLAIGSRHLRTSFTNDNDNLLWFSTFIKVVDWPIAMPTTYAPDIDSIAFRVSHPGNICKHHTRQDVHKAEQ